LPRLAIIGGLAVGVAIVGALAILLGANIVPSFANASLAASSGHSGQGSTSSTSSTDSTGQFSETGAAAASHVGGPEITVTSVGTNTITGTRTDRKGTSTTVHITTTGSTTYTRLGKTVQRSSITAGTKIRVQGTKASDGTITAMHVEVVVPSFAGTVSNVSGSIITITSGRSKTTHTIHTTGTTTYTEDGKTVTASAVTTNARIRAFGSLNSDKSLNAEQIEVVLPHVAGQVKTVNGTTVTLTQRNGTLTVHLSNSTTYTNVTWGTSGPTSSAATVSDVQAGKFIVAEGTKNSDGSLNATSVRILSGTPSHGSGSRHHHTKATATPGA
jgi:hypothetical protein